MGCGAAEHGVHVRHEHKQPSQRGLVGLGLRCLCLSGGAGAGASCGFAVEALKPLGREGAVLDLCRQVPCSVLRFGCAATEGLLCAWSSELRLGITAVSHARALAAVNAYGTRMRFIAASETCSAGLLEDNVLCSCVRVCDPSRLASPETLTGVSGCLVRVINGC